MLFRIKNILILIQQIFKKIYCYVINNSIRMQSVGIYKLVSLEPIRSAKYNAAFCIAQDKPINNILTLISN